MTARHWLIIISLVWLGFNLGLCFGRGAWLAMLVIVPINLAVIVIASRWAVSER